MISVLEDRSRLQDQIKQLISKCDRLDQDKKRLSSDLSTLKIEIHALGNEKHSISEEAQAQLKASTDIIKAKNVVIKTLEDDILRCTSEAEHFKEENMSLLADVQDLQRALKEMLSMTEELINENSELKVKLETATEELDELVWESKELEEYNIFLEELINESDREAAGSRKDSDKINDALEIENALLHDKLRHLQSQLRKERKASYLTGSRKLKAIQDLERRLIDLKWKNNALNEHLLAEQSKSDFNQSTVVELQKREQNHRIENQGLHEQLEKSNKHEVDLRNELAEMNKLLQESEDKYSDYQAIVANNSKLMVQNATLQGFIEQRRIGLSCGNGNTNGSKSGLPLNASSSPNVTSSLTKEPDQEVHQMATSETPDELGPIFSLQESMSLMFEEQNRQLTSVNQLLIGEVQEIKSQLAETPGELGNIFSLQESMSLMFEEQNRQLTSIKQLMIGEVQDMKRKLAEIDAVKSVKIVEREEKVETSDLFTATNVKEMSHFSTRVATLEGEVESLKKKITDVDKINCQTLALSQQKDSKIEYLLEAVDALTAKNNKLKHEKNKWKAMVEESQLTMAELKEQNINEVTFIEEQYNQYKTKTDQLIDIIKADLYNREKELEAAEHKFRMSNIAARQLPGLEENLEAAEKTINFLSGALDEKNKTCRRLQDEAAETDVVGLRERNKELAVDLAEVEQKLRNIRQEKQVLKGSLAKADLKLMDMEMDLVSADRVKHGKNYLNITQQDFNKHKGHTVIKVGEGREAKTCAKCAGDTAEAHRIEQVSKEPKCAAFESKTLSEGWSTANIMVVSKEGMMKTMFEEQEQRLKAFVQNNMEKSNNQIDNLRKKLRKMIYQASRSKCTSENHDKTIDDDNSNDLTETLSDVTSASYHSTQSTEDSITSASDSDVTVYQEPIIEQRVENNLVDTEETDIKPSRGPV
ncbi:uncharacterized protein PFB0145c-like [Anneissia japonica]|uniref:uncharacterized protein PFB0145c-like n=1 Tax=Anneissia japonica TaxID=1529436 RepID=UPI0014259F21|nr:uncharacterized protein PFB0145c-like [Anneissia japonica]